MSRQHIKDLIKNTLQFTFTDVLLLFILFIIILFSIYFYISLNYYLFYIKLIQQNKIFIYNTTKGQMSIRL